MTEPKLAMAHRCPQTVFSEQRDYSKRKKEEGGGSNGSTQMFTLMTSSFEDYLLSLNRVMLSAAPLGKEAYGGLLAVGACTNAVVGKTVERRAGEMMHRNNVDRTDCGKSSVGRRWSDWF